MTIIPHQPILPPEANYNTAELGFINDQPDGLFPENQDSNFGLKRKLWANQAQIGIEQIETIWNELFVKTSSLFLDEWERQLGLPMSPPGITMGNRRARVLARVMRGPFTMHRLWFVIETYLEPAIGGDAIQLVPQGVAIPPIGLPLYSGVADIESVYRIYENPKTYTYEVWIRSEVTPDIQLDYELRRITPAGYTLIYRNDKVDILDMEKTIISDGPVVYLRMGTTLADISGFAAAVTNNGTTVMAAPGLLVRTVSRQRRRENFQRYVQLDLGGVRAESGIQCRAGLLVPVADQCAAVGRKFRHHLSKAAEQPYIRIDDQGALRFGKSNVGDIAHTRTGLQTGVKYSVVVNYNDYEAEDLH